MSVLGWIIFSVILLFGLINMGIGMYQGELYGNNRTEMASKLRKKLGRNLTKKEYDMIDKSFIDLY